MKKIYVYIGVVLLIFISCFYSHMYHLTEKDMEWMNPYVQNDTIVFEYKDDVDTMIVTEEKIINSSSPFRQNEGAEDFCGNAFFCFVLNHKQRKIHGRFVVIKEGGNILSIGILIGDRRYSFDDAKYLSFFKKNIKGEVLDDVICVDSTNSELYVDNEATPQMFMWSKSKGLLMYQYRNGNIYTLSTLRKSKRIK